MAGAAAFARQKIQYGRSRSPSQLASHRAGPQKTQTENALQDESKVMIKKREFEAQRARIVLHGRDHRDHVASQVKIASATLTTAFDTDSEHADDTMNTYSTSTKSRQAPTEAKPESWQQEDEDENFNLKDDIEDELTQTLDSGAITAMYDHIKSTLQPSIFEEGDSYPSTTNEDLAEGIWSQGSGNHNELGIGHELRAPSIDTDPLIAPRHRQAFGVGPQRLLQPLEPQSIRQPDLMQPKPNRPLQVPVIVTEAQQRSAEEASGAADASRYFIRTAEQPGHELVDNTDGPHRRAETFTFENPVSPVENPPIVHLEGVKESKLHEIQNAESGLDYSESDIIARSFEDLQKESFDYEPSAKPSQLASTSQSTTLASQLQNVRSAGQSERVDFVTSLSLDDWEEAGDWFLQQFQLTIDRFRRLRKEKRKIAHELEQRIYTRHLQVAIRKRKLDEALDGMKVTGERVIETPKPEKRRASSR